MQRPLSNRAPRLLWITPPRGSLDEVFRILSDVPKTLGTDCALLLRRPGLSARLVHDEAVRLRNATRDRDIRLFLQRADLCLAANADGVHLTERGLRPCDIRALVPCVGVSRHDRHGLERAFDQGADYATLSPVYPSIGKGQPLGPASFAKQILHLGPVLALGGVTTPDHARTMARAGAFGIATISGMRASGDALRLLSPFLDTNTPSPLKSP